MYCTWQNQDEVGSWGRRIATERGGGYHVPGVRCRQLKTGGGTTMMETQIHPALLQTKKNAIN